jgi:hypothetical protein
VSYYSVSATGQKPISDKTTIIIIIILKMNACRLLVGKPEGKRSPGRPRS